MNARELGIIDGMEKVAKARASDAAIGATAGGVLGWEVAKDMGRRKGKGALLGSVIAIPLAMYAGPKIRKKMRKEAVSRAAMRSSAARVSLVDSAKKAGPKIPKAPKGPKTDPQKMGMGAFTMRRGGEIKRTVPNQQPPKPPRY